MDQPGRSSADLEHPGNEVSGSSRRSDSGPPESPSATRCYDSPAVRDRLRVAGIDRVEIQRRGTKVPGVKRQPLRLGLRWVVEATNTWWSNYGQLRRNTDRRPGHRHAALCLATAILIVGRLID